MNKKQHPTLRRMNRVTACVSFHPTILARLDARNANRSEAINSALARLFLIEDGKADMTPEERRRFKTLALLGTLDEDHEEKIDKQEAAIRREKAAPPKPVRNSPWPS